MIRGASAFVAALAVADSASAGDAPKLLGGSKAPKTYPVLESRYIKQFAGPTVSCGACFGFYRTQWRRWEEACGEPLPVDAGPTQYTPPPGTVIPEPEKPGTPPVPKVETGPKDPPKTEAPKTEPPKKEPEKKEPPKIELPKIEPEKKEPPKEKTVIELPPAALPNLEQKPASVEIVIPALPTAPVVKPVQSVAPAPVPPLPAPTPLPTVIVPLNGK